MKERFGERKAHSQLKQAFNICVQLDQEKGLAYSPHLREFEEEEKRKEAEGDAYAPVAWEVPFRFHHVITRLCAAHALARPHTTLSNWPVRGSAETAGRRAGASAGATLLLLLLWLVRSNERSALFPSFPSETNTHARARTESHSLPTHLFSAFNDADDLAQNCPGPSEEDHE